MFYRLCEWTLDEPSVTNIIIYSSLKMVLCVWQTEYVGYFTIFFLFFYRHLNIFMFISIFRFHVILNAVYLFIDNSRSVCCSDGSDSGFEFWYESIKLTATWRVSRIMRESVITLNKRWLTGKICQASIGRRLRISDDINIQKSNVLVGFLISQGF